MKKIILIGRSGSGKTTLTRKLLNMSSDYKKTQSIEYCNNIIDTPGEYLENKRYYKALLVTSLDADAILLIKDVNDAECYFPPGFAYMFNKPAIGVVTKTDTGIENIESAIRCLQNAGAEKIYKISSYTGEGLDDLRNFLEYL
ncbi:EutP/PduV family microcompartment system protein [Lutispora thermophila]|uniref:Ethanolamine utilization protein EutP n=1 Tax=Lutispora thermophila DSM 19022 TaxID=1122184 RepID=A0A1M6FIA1_9FIRM|nr:EutP/PduV family microcompartment system protein [Lutispora thermophila]SHI97415.1 ethanolamine utilization protein EutP [Lutispora thermophila DSM 19022]